MAQADTIIPPGVEGLDRYAYVNNSPLNFVDPTGHEPHTPGSCYDSVNGICGYKYSIPKKIKPSIPFVPSYGNGLVGPPTPEGYVTSHTEYMGGASPAGIYEWQDIDGDDDIVDALDAFVTTADMLSPTGDSTLEAYISYITSDDKNVNEISISITNNGESSAILQYIEMSEEALPSFDSCNINTTCIFDPQSPVSIDPGQNATLTICQSCLADGSTIYSYPFNSNQNKYIEVVMVLYTFVDAGLNGVESINLPFIYTIPPR